MVSESFLTGGGGKLRVTLAKSRANAACMRIENRMKTLILAG
jgi:hypothetical protein